MDAHIEGLLKLAHLSQILEYLHAGLYTFFICDVIDLLPREIKVIWGRKWTGVNMFYILCRSTAFVHVSMWIYGMTPLSANREPCLRAGFASSLIALLGNLSAQAIFFLRTYALWGASHIMATFLSLLAVVMICVGIVINSMNMRSTTPLPSPAHVPQCFLVATGSTTRAMWGILNGRIIDLILVGLVFVAKFRRYRCPNNPQLVTKIFQDATLHFGLNFLISVTTTIMFFTLPSVTKQFSTT